MYLMCCATLGTSGLPLISLAAPPPLSLCCKVPGVRRGRGPLSLAHTLLHMLKDLARASSTT